MKICTKCNLPCEDTVMNCPQCGETLDSITGYQQQPEAKPNKMKKILIVSIIVNVVVLFILGWSDDYGTLPSYISDYYESAELLSSFSTLRMSNESANGLYHRYGCKNFDESSFCWITRAAELERKHLCPLCCPNG